MSPEKKFKFLQDRSLVRHLYRDTDLNVSQISRLVRLSETTCHKMIEGKDPEWLRELRDREKT